jgi:hypothetical protein
LPRGQFSVDRPPDRLRRGLDCQLPDQIRRKADLVEIRPAALAPRKMRLDGLRVGGLELAVNVRRQAPRHVSSGLYQLEEYREQRASTAICWPRQRSGR